jgi:ubiquinone/menaquinone biosynthesis C-methylase UbiE
MSKNESRQDESTYFVDAENAAEMARLMSQARQVTENMGSLFPPHIDISSLHHVFDLACGPGQWVLDVAHSYPHIQVTGGDISQLMIAYATTLARDVPNANFQIIDAQKPLTFPDQTFDFIQARLITAFMLASAWPGLLNECKRLLQPGGFVYLIEGENFGVSNSVSLERFNALFAQAMRKAGHSFVSEGNNVGITPLLPRLLQDQGFQNISQRAFAINFSAGQKINGPWYANYKTGMKLLQPFLLYHEVATQSEIDALYERTLQDIQSPDFCAQLFYVAVSGQRPL